MISIYIFIEGGREALFRLGVVPVLLNVLVNAALRDTSDILLELITALAADSDDVKKLIADSTADMYLTRLVSLLSSSSQSEDDEQLVKLASELIVLVLTGGRGSAPCGYTHPHPDNKL